jgi:RNA polymerase sigma-B factor
LIEAHLPLARQVARRYCGRGEPLDDLVQVGALGLIRASERFDPERGVSFATFATRVIDGEIRRHLQDRADPVRIPRRLRRVGAAVHRSDEAELDSRLEAIRDADEPLATSEARVLLGRLAEGLDEDERRIVFLRFHADMTERQMAGVLGISQAQVSRKLSRALGKLRARADGDIARSGVISPLPGEKSARNPRSRGTEGSTMSAVEGRPEKRGRSAASRASAAPAQTKPDGYSGRLLVRMPSELHAELARSAHEANVSLNRLVTDVLAASTAREPPRARSRALRWALVTNVSLLVLTVIVATVLLVLALERGL